MDQATAEDYFLAFTDSLPENAATVTIGRLADDGDFIQNMFAYPLVSDVQLICEIPTDRMGLAGRITAFSECLQCFIAANDQYDGKIRLVVQLKAT